MGLIDFLREYFVVSTMARIIEKLHRVDGTVFSLVFTRRNNWPLPTISMADIERKIGSKAVTARGAHAIPVGSAAASITSIEPMPIRLSSFITGKDLNDLKNLFGNGDEKGKRLVSDYLDRKVEELMLDTAATRDALCAQAITGTIDYQMKTDTGVERYQVKYGDGTPLSYSPDVKWNDPSVAIGTILIQLTAMHKLIAAAGHGGKVEFLAGANAYTDLLNIVAALPNENRIGAKGEDGVITVGPYKVHPDFDIYTDTAVDGSITTKNEVDADKIVGFVPGLLDLDYCAVDDIDGNLEAVPFFSKYSKLDDPSGIKVISESKPMPLVSVTSFCWATVHDSSIVPVDNTVNVSVLNGVDTTAYTEAQLNAHTKTWILELATARGYEMTTTSSNTKAEIVADFLSLQTAANG